MSRAAKMDHEFNKEKFAEMLNVAIGDRRQQTFADECGLSAGHINRYINCQKEQPPMPSTIWKIAVVAQNNISYEDLMDAAGYDHRKFEKSQDDKVMAKVETNGTYRKAVIKSIIVSALSEKDFKWTGLSTEETVPYDLGIEVEGGIVSKWFFAIYTLADPEEDKLEIVMKQRIFAYYGALAFLEPAQHVKLSFAADSEEVYMRLKTLVPKTLPISVSAILIDWDDFCIKREEYLIVEPKIEADLVAETIDYHAK